MTREEIVARSEKSKWAGQAIGLHLLRVTNGRAQAAWVNFVDRHTKSSPVAAERKQEWSPVILARDCAGYCGLSEEGIRVAMQECVDLGFTPRMSDEPGTEGFHRFKVDYKALAAAPNYTEPRNCYQREAGGFGRKPMATAEGVDKAKDSTESESCAESRPTPVGPIIIAPGKKATSKELWADLFNHSPLELRIEGVTRASGKIRLDFFSHAPSGEAQAESDSRRLSSAPPTEPGLGKIVAVIAAADSTGLPPGHPMLPFSDDPLIAGLAELGLPPEDKTLAELRAGLEVNGACEMAFFFREIRSAIANLKKGQTMTQLILPSLLRKANQMWRNGGQLAWRKDKALEAELAARQSSMGEAPVPAVSPAQPAPAGPSLADLKKELGIAKRTARNGATEEDRDAAVLAMRSLEVEIARRESQPRR
jgi:hypothetical protein